jgi:hypothetical protein
VDTLDTIRLWSLSPTPRSVAAEAVDESIRQAIVPVVWTGPGNRLLSQRGGIGLGQLAKLFPLPDALPPRSTADHLTLEV